MPLAVVPPASVKLTSTVTVGRDLSATWYTKLPSSSRTISRLVSAPALVNRMPRSSLSRSLTTTTLFAVRLPAPAVITRWRMRNS